MQELFVNLWGTAFCVHITCMYTLLRAVFLLRVTIQQPMVTQWNIILLREIELHRLFCWFLGNEDKQRTHSHHQEHKPALQPQLDNKIELKEPPSASFGKENQCPTPVSNSELGASQNTETVTQRKPAKPNSVVSKDEDATAVAPTAAEAHSPQVEPGEVGTSNSTDSKSAPECEATKSSPDKHA